jgi:DNA-binding CsgD family transcriptional regulator
MTPLTDLERSIVELVILGKSNREIAEDLGIALNSVRAYMVPIFTKAKVNNRTELAVLYHRNQVIEELARKAENIDIEFNSIAPWIDGQKDELP